MANMTIEKVIGREILDSRGNPTVEAQIFLADGTVAFGTAPSGLIFQTAGIGIFFAVAPHIAGWLLEKVTDLTLVLLDFLLI